MYETKEEIKPDGTVSLRIKTRLIACCFLHVKSVYFYETNAPVIKLTSIWVILVFAAVRDMELHRMDVVTAFLQWHSGRSIPGAAECIRK